MDPWIDRKWIVNQDRVEVRFLSNERLIDVLRDRLGLTGTKSGCGEGECGACSVLINGDLKLSCLTLAAALADGCAITTVEGLEKEPEGKRLQEAFLEQGAVQCGFCTPGMLLASYWVVKHPRISLAEGLSGNLCRCTGYQKIFEAVSSCRAPGDGGEGP